MECEINLQREADEGVVRGAENEGVKGRKQGKGEIKEGKKGLIGKR